MRLVAEVEPKRIGCGWPLRSEADVEHFVEEPLVPAVKILLAKNIHASQSSANMYTALNSSRAYIELDIASLVFENLVTLAELSLGPDVDMNGSRDGRPILYKHHGLQLNLTPGVTVAQVEEDFVAMAGLLTLQEPWRARPVTLVQAKQILADRGEEVVNGHHPDLIRSSHLRNWKTEWDWYCYVAGHEPDSVGAGVSSENHKHIK